MANSRREQANKIFTLFSESRIIPKRDFYQHLDNFNKAEGSVYVLPLTEVADIERMNYAMRIVELTKRNNSKINNQNKLPTPFNEIPNGYNLNDIPSDIWNEVFSHLSFYEIQEQSTTCKAFRSLAINAPISDPIIFGNSFVIVAKPSNGKKDEMVTAKSLMNILSNIDKKTITNHELSIKKLMPKVRLRDNAVDVLIPGVTVTAVSLIALCVIGVPLAIFISPLMLLGLVIPLLLGISLLALGMWARKLRLNEIKETSEYKDLAKTTGFFEQLVAYKNVPELKSTTPELQLSSTAKSSIIIEDANEEATPLTSLFIM